MNVSGLGHQGAPGDPKSELAPLKPFAFEIRRIA
jgi:hypothetical protein